MRPSRTRPPPDTGQSRQPSSAFPAARRSPRQPARCGAQASRRRRAGGPRAGGVEVGLGPPHQHIRALVVVQSRWGAFFCPAYSVSPQWRGRRVLTTSQAARPEQPSGPDAPRAIDPGPGFNVEPTTTFPFR
jgi:hypothetical protein